MKLTTARLVVLSLCVSIVAIGAPGLERRAEAQATCSAAIVAEFVDCIDDYNNATAGSTTTILVSANLSFPTPVTVDNTTTAQLIVEGNGYRFTNLAAGDLVTQTDGNSEWRDLTFTSTTTSGYKLIVDAGQATLNRVTMTVGDGVWQRSSEAVTVADSTFHELETAVAVNIAKTITVNRSTLADNDTAFSSFAGSVTITGSIVTRNDSNCLGIAVVDGGGNLIDFTFEATDNCGEILGHEQLATFLDTDLAANGCTSPCTHTLALLAGSPAIDHHVGCANGLTDQRAVARTGGRCDAGAFELTDCEFTVDVATGDDFLNGVACYNRALANETVTLRLTADIATEAEILIDNVPGAVLIVEGAGHTLASAPSMYSRRGDVTIADLTFGDVLFIARAETVVLRSTFTGSNIAVEIRSPNIEFFDSTFHDLGTALAFSGTSNGEIVVERSTFADVSSVFSGAPDAGDVALTGSLLVRNGNNCSLNVGLVDGGGNIFGESGTDCPGVPVTSGAAASVAAELAPNGCVDPCTETLALLAGSPAIDAHADCDAGLTDQRGIDRPAGACDAGAFEAVVCDGQVVTIDMNTNGGAGTGTSGPDVILGTPGDDVIDARGGDDVVCAGDGEDVVNGGSGADRIFGGRDADQLYGDGQDDKVWGEHGHDRLEGGDGDDKLRGNGGNDRLYGQDGKDTLWGFNGDDRAWGGDGDDKVRGNADHDELYGGNGDDRVTGGDGNDLAYGGSDNDEVVGGTGTDELHGDGGDDVLEGNGSEDTLYGGGGQDDLYGGGGNDEIFGEGSNDEMFGGGGQNDLCDGGSGTDVADSACENTANL